MYKIFLPDAALYKIDAYLEHRRDIKNFSLGGRNFRQVTRPFCRPRNEREEHRQRNCAIWRTTIRDHTSCRECVLTIDEEKNEVLEDYFDLCIGLYDLGSQYSENGEMRGMRELREEYENLRTRISRLVKQDEDLLSDISTLWIHCEGGGNVLEASTSKYVTMYNPNVETIRTEMDSSTRYLNLILDEPIRNKAFSDLETVIGVCIRSPCQQIGKGAFRGCKSLLKVTFPPSLTVAEEAFKGCESLGNVNFSGTELTIGLRAFVECKTLTDVNIEVDGPLVIEESAFIDCGQLRSLNLKSKGGEIGDFAFSQNASLMEVSISGVEKIGAFAFKKLKNLRNLNLGEGIKIIGAFAFSDCTFLEALTIPSSVSKIEQSAFAGCSSLRSVELLGQNVDIEEFVFLHCNNLKVVVTKPNATITIGPFNIPFERAKDMEQRS